MPVVGLPFWGVRVKPGDVLRSNATYDTRLQSTYENMGIVVSLLAPDTPDGKAIAPGMDPFKRKADGSINCRSKGLGAKPGKRRLCIKGFVTHGPLQENSNAGGPGGTWSAKPGAPTTTVNVSNFQYLPGDLSSRDTTGIPTVKLGSTLRFNNLEGGAIYHTITSCRFPCLGTTGAAFPLADGGTSASRSLDFDSSEVGFGTPEIGPAKQSLDWGLPVTPEAGYAPGEVVTYYCRIHPFMRGAFEVTK
jgi:hypothetical protein